MLRSFGTAGLALTAVVCVAAAQRPRADVQKFQWDPVVLHIGAERGTGIEIYLSTDTLHWAIAWFPPESLSTWLPSADSVIEKRGGADAPRTTPVLTGRFGTKLRIVRAMVGGQQAVGVQIFGPPFKNSLNAWMPDDYARSLRKALSKSVEAAKKLGAPAAADSTPRVYEMWEVDGLPYYPPGPARALPPETIPQYSLGGSITLAFIVDSTGHVDHASITLLSADDTRLGRQFAAVVESWPMSPGMLDGHPVAIRMVMTHDLRSDSRIGVNDQRVFVGGNHD